MSHLVLNTRVEWPGHGYQLNRFACSLVTEAENQIPHCNSDLWCPDRLARLCQLLLLRLGCYRSSSKYAISRKGKVHLAISKDTQAMGSWCEWYLSTESFFTILQGLFLMVEISFFFCSTCSISMASSSSDGDSSSDELEEAEVLAETQSKGHRIANLVGVRGKVTGPWRSHSDVLTVSQHLLAWCEPRCSGQGCLKPG